MRRTLFEDVHEDFRSSFRTFLEREVVGEEGRYGDWERAGIVPREVFARAGAGGFLGMSVPERYGGAGAEDFRFNLIVGEETERAGVGSFGLGITLQNDICLPYFLSYCSEAQRERWLPGIASGELITAIAMSEPGMGSDLAGIATRARREDGHYVVDGTKTFITNGINADLVITAVRTGEARHRGLSLLVLERGMEGFSRGRKLEKIGQHGQDTAELSFAGVRVPLENLLGKEGEGFATSSPTSPRSVCRSPPRRWPPPRRRCRGRSTTCASGAPSASRSAPSRARASRSPRCARKLTSRARTSTAACRSSTRAR